MKKLLYLLIITLTAQTLQAQYAPTKQRIDVRRSQLRANYAKIDAHALQVKRTRSIEKLTHQLTYPFQRKEDKVRAIFRWIAHNIAYDCALKKQIEQGRAHNRTALETYRKGAAVCGGYALLFDKMCLLAGIESEVVRGFARTSVSQIGIDTPISNHAWNAVKINNKWKLVDVSWASGYGTCNQGGFKKEWKEAYFLTDPQEFIKNHFPQNPKWQLLARPFTKQEFNQQPHYWYPYFSQGIKGLSPKKGPIKIRKKESLTFEFIGKNRKDYTFQIGFEEKRKGKKMIVPQKQIKSSMRGTKHQLKYHFDQRGNYKVYIIINSQITATYLVSVT